MNMHDKIIPPAAYTGGLYILEKKSEFAQFLFDFHKIGTNMFGRSMGSHIGTPTVFLIHRVRGWEPPSGKFTKKIIKNRVYLIFWSF